MIYTFLKSHVTSTVHFKDQRKKGNISYDIILPACTSECTLVKVRSFKAGLINNESNTCSYLLHNIRKRRKMYSNTILYGDGDRSDPLNK
jgi:hypothetical protein